MKRSANRPILVRRVNLWWYALALVVIVLLGWLSLINLIPALLMPLVLFAAIFWLASFVMAVIAKLRAPRPEISQ
jgi:hypothetical protein